MSELEKRDRPDLSTVADAAHEAALVALEQFKRPSFRAGFGASLLSTALLARAGVRFAPTLFVSLMVGAAVEHLYGMAEDIHSAVTGRAPELVFHGAGCPGHTTGKPAKCCMAADDATGQV